MHAHFDCFSGISGDMVLGAFVDLGVPLPWLVEQIRMLPIGDVSIEARDVRKKGVGAKQIEVIERGVSKPRTYRDILAILDAGSLEERVRRDAQEIFRRIAEAEAHIHGCAVEKVHFHEVGAVDSIVDVVGAALCLAFLKIESVSCSPLPLGAGFVDCDHGRLPVPAPATLEILKGIPVAGGESHCELVTPTGAAIAASMAKDFGDIPAMRIEKIGYGAGNRDLPDRPNLLRVLVGHRADQDHRDQQEDVCVLETNVDDMNPEIHGYLMERLLALGALDVCLLPAVMKKNRPGTKIEVICLPEQMDSVARCLLTESTTLGIRYRRSRRWALPRAIISVSTQFGDIQVKCTTDPDGRERYTPEYDACRKVALEQNVPLKTVYDAAITAAMR